MKPLYHYIFNSGELFLPENNILPSSIPEIFTDKIQDVLDLELNGSPARSVLLVPSASASAAVANSVSDSVPPAGRWVRLRVLMASDVPGQTALASSATRALGLVNWHNSHRFCGKCGSSTILHASQMALVCTACNTTVFPRLSPAVIVLVQKDDKILLARHKERNQDVFSCIAGYVEHGETLEECVAREVYEETGLRVTNIRYAGSQSWPFPDQYMIAFYADWESGEIRVDPAELLEACWFDRDNLPNFPLPGTVAWKLITRVFPVLSKK